MMRSSLTPSTSSAKREAAPKKSAWREAYDGEALGERGSVETRVGGQVAHALVALEEEPENADSLRVTRGTE
ncbi:MAG TPA: hypothetical protein VII84_03020 [Acidimicrobiales bacterium]